MIVWSGHYGPPPWTRRLRCVRVVLSFGLDLVKGREGRVFLTCAVEEIWWRVVFSSLLPIRAV